MFTRFINFIIQLFSKPPVIPEPPVIYVRPTPIVVAPPPPAILPPTVVKNPHKPGSIDWYQWLWGMAKISEKPEEVARLNRALSKYAAGATRYRAVNLATGVPVELIAAIHGRESSFDFSSYLGNGDPICMKSVNVPAGRGPFATWEAGAIDALILNGMAAQIDWTIPKMLQLAEKYNGTGYLKYHTDVMSPYIWSCTNIYSGKGKYTYDGHFSATATDGQVGVAAFLLALQ